MRAVIGPRQLSLLHRLREAHPSPRVIDAVVTVVVQAAVTIPFVVPRSPDVLSRYLAHVRHDDAQCAAAVVA
ncbi:hypothetical protein GCM10020000_36020 [Streptomyces olivoverticillatus]